MNLDMCDANIQKHQVFKSPSIFILFWSHNMIFFKQLCANCAFLIETLYICVKRNKRHQSYCLWCLFLLETAVICTYWNEFRILLKSAPSYINAMRPYRHFLYVHELVDYNQISPSWDDLWCSVVWWSAARSQGTLHLTSCLTDLTSNPTQTYLTQTVWQNLLIQINKMHFKAGINTLKPKQYLTIWEL